MAAAAVHRPPSSRADHDGVAGPWFVQVDVPRLPPGRPSRCVFVHLGHMTDHGLEPVAAFSVPRVPDGGFPDRLERAVARLLRREDPPAPEPAGDPAPPTLIEQLEILVDRAAAEVRRQGSPPSGVWAKGARAARQTGAGEKVPSDDEDRRLRDAEAVRAAHNALLAARERQDRARYLMATCPPRHFGGPSRLRPRPMDRPPEHDRDGDLAAAREEERCSERLVAARSADLARALERRDRVSTRAPETPDHS